MAGDIVEPLVDGGPGDAATTDPTPEELRDGRRKNLDHTFRSMSRGTSVMMLATIVVVVLQFATRVVVTRHVSPDAWGEFNLGLALSSLLALLTAFGIPAATARSMAFEETYEARMVLVRRAVYVSIPVGILATVLVYVFASQIASPFHTAGLTQVFQLFSISIGLTMLSNVLTGIFQGLERAEPYALFVQIVNPALFLVVTALLIFFGWGFTGVLWGYVLSWVGAFAGLAVYSWVRLPQLLRRLSASTFTGDATARVSFVTLSVTLFGVAAFTYITSYADTLLLGVFRPEDIVGQYSSAMTLTRLLLVGTGTVTFIYLPITSRLRRQRDFAGLRETYVTVTRWMALLTLPFTFLFFFDPTFSLGFTFGAAQVGGADSLRLLVLTNTVAILLGPAVATLGGLGEARQVLWFTLISAVLNIGLCIVLIPPYGMFGAAMAWSIARIVFPGLSLIRIFQQHRITPFAAHFLRPIALTTLILAPVFYFVLPRPTPLWIPVDLVLPFLVFGLSILITRSVDRGDVTFVKAAEQRLGPAVRPLRRLRESRLAVEAAAATLADKKGAP
ncbi:MAG: oligosaccharide flippase family protein [Thermoplasmata archaeon]|nr:oligosaccharide flippase family protein [Thermoplasmata archaeon]